MRLCILYDALHLTLLGRYLEDTAKGEENKKNSRMDNATEKPSMSTNSGYLH